MIAAHGVIASSRARSTLVDPATTCGWVWRASNAGSLSTPTALSLQSPWSTGPESGGLYPATVATIGSVAHGGVIGEEVRVASEFDATLFAGALSNVPSASSASFLSGREHVSISNSTMEMTEKVGSIANLGTAGAAALTSASNATSPRLLATPARLRTDGSNDLMAGATGIGAGPATLYGAVVFRPVVDQTDNTDRGLFYLTPNNNDSRLFASLGGGGASDRVSMVFFTAAAGAQSYRYRAANLTAGVAYLLEWYWGGTSYYAKLNGSAMVLDAANSPDSADLLAGPNYAFGARYSAGPTAYGQADHIEHTLATSDQSAVVQEWAAATYGISIA